MYTCVSFVDTIKPVTSPSNFSLPAGPCRAGVDVIVTLSFKMTVSQGSKPTALPFSRLAPIFGGKRFGNSLYEFPARVVQVITMLIMT